ncbi:putative Tim10/DDP family zinc finger [Medicago truncatula]|uniref:Mitochondrial import inner membrane translocase subunit n=1 Tax=Medicago truncatula TaxID=3880 RepID=A0A396I8E5_MEDTR|nr:mitochondrial import inner membrane translocase subunit Tim9 [Medicago truncatula]RHN59117.1 putative Tim10/DDP family zinc finger [Medicago truncatula]
MDKNIFGEVDNLPEEDKKRMTTMVEQLQTRDSLRLYNSLVERCFNNCVSSFYRSSLNKPEETCVLRCAGKYLRFSSHVGVKFSDINQGASTTDKQ